MSPSNEFNDLSKQEDNAKKFKRRMSDARWRANLASCFETLKLVIPFNTRASKRQLSKALILKEASKHITLLENVLLTILREKGCLGDCVDIESWCENQVSCILESFEKNQRLAESSAHRNAAVARLNHKRRQTRRRAVPRATYRRRGTAPAIPSRTVPSAAATATSPVSLTFPSKSGGFHELTMESPGDELNPAVWVYRESSTLTERGFSRSAGNLIETVYTPKKTTKMSQSSPNLSVSGFKPLKLSPIGFPRSTSNGLRPTLHYDIKHESLLPVDSSDGDFASGTVNMSDLEDLNVSGVSMHSLLCDELMWMSDDDDDNSSSVASSAGSGFPAKNNPSVLNDSTPRRRGKRSSDFQLQQQFGCPRKLKKTRHWSSSSPSAATTSSDADPRPTATDVNCSSNVRQSTPRGRSLAEQTLRVAKRCRRSLQLYYDDNNVQIVEADSSSFVLSTENELSYDAWVSEDGATNSDVCPAADTTTGEAQEDWEREVAEFVAASLTSQPDGDLPDDDVDAMVDADLRSSEVDSPFLDARIKTENLDDDYSVELLDFGASSMWMHDVGSDYVDHELMISSQHDGTGARSRHRDNSPLLSQTSCCEMPQFDKTAIDREDLNNNNNNMMSCVSDCSFDSLAADLPPLFPTLPNTLLGGGCSACCWSDGVDEAEGGFCVSCHGLTPLRTPTKIKSECDRSDYGRLADSCSGFDGQYSPLFNRHLFNV